VDEVFGRDRAGNPIDRTDDDQWAFRILKPLIGNYTVADAAMLLAALYAHGSTADEFECDAAFRLRSVLEAFVGQARISTATCAETRAYIAAMPTDEDKEHASEFTITCIRERICWDLRDVRDGKFHGEQFAGSPFNKMPNWLDDHEKRFEIWKAGP
jgi:hypothetical protein